MEKPLLKNTISYQKIFEALPVLFLILKPDPPSYTVLEANQVFVKTSGLPHAEIHYRSLFDILPDSKVISNLRASLDRVIATRTTDRLPIQQYDVKNPQTGRMEELYWLVTNTPVFDGEGGIEYIIHHVENVTEMVLSEKKRKDELRLAAKQLSDSYNELQLVNNELDAFTYSVSHDLRAPLRAINGYSNMILEDFGQTLDPEAVNCLSTIISNAHRMGNLIDDLLAFSRLGKQNPTKVMLNMNAIADSVVTELKIHAPKHMQINILQLAPVEGDSSMIRQVMTNLISNAVKFSHKKEQPAIEIGCIKEEDRMVYYVRDNGAGFDMKYYSKLFGVFQRLHNKHEFEGTGVGLALVHRIVKKHGGQVWGDATPGEGAIFYFSIPVVTDNKKL